MFHSLYVHLADISEMWLKPIIICHSLGAAGRIVVLLLPAKHVEDAVALARSRLPVAHMHTNHVWGRKGAAYIALGLGNDDVHLRREHAAQCYSNTKTDGERGGDDLVVGAEVDGHKSQPDNAGGVHGECNVLGFVEVGRHIASLEGVVGAAHNKQAIVTQRSHYAHVTRVTDEVHLPDAGVALHRLGGFQHNQRNLHGQLETNKEEGDYHLCPGAHEAGLACADFLLAASQDACNAVGFGYQGGVAHGRRQSH